MKPPLVVDTGGLLRAIARRPDGRATWPAFEAALLSASALIVPALILPEVDYFLKGSRASMRKLLAEIFDPATTYELEPSHPKDIARAIELDLKFADLELGLVDGVVAAVAERRGIFRILTIDHSDFEPLRVGPRFSKAFTLLP